jgi:hypothetical protein
MGLLLHVPPEPAELRANRGTGWTAERAEDNASRLSAILWGTWEADLLAAGFDRDRFRRVVEGYRAELWLWRAGERPWVHAVEGLIGRIERRAGGQ